MDGHTAMAKKAAAVSLAIIASVGFWWVTAGRGASATDTVYTVPQVLAALPRLRGRTILVRAMLTTPWSLPPRPMPKPLPCSPHCPFLKVLAGPYGYNGRKDFMPMLFVIPAPEDPVLAALRSLRLLRQPYLAEPVGPHVYRVQITMSPPVPCAAVVPYPCPRALLLDSVQ